MVEAPVGWWKLRLEWWNLRSGCSWGNPVGVVVAPVGVVDTGTGPLTLLQVADTDMGPQARLQIVDTATGPLTLVGVVEAPVGVETALVGVGYKQMMY